jgi:uncharacterized protein (DUF305 family)
MRKYLIGISAAALVALAAGCGGDDAGHDTGSEHGKNTSAPAESGAATKHNDQDVMFAQMMIPHHQQAVDMSTMAAQQATDAKVKDLAARIKKAQEPEIQQMTSMLEAWGESTSMEDMPGMDHGDHGSASGEGMMTPADMQRLEKVTGTEFHQMWLQMMIKHHQGALTMAQAQIEQGSNADATTLARQIMDSQQTEIDEMQKMLK